MRALWRAIDAGTWVLTLAIEAEVVLFVMVWRVRDRKMLELEIDMSLKIEHLAIRVDDIEAAGEFYEKVLGFRDLHAGKVRDHYSRHMTDGRLDIALIQYDADTKSKESQAAGDGPCIHHFGMSVDDMDEWVDKIRGLGCEIISEPGVVPVKFRAPGGVVAEIAPRGRFDPNPAGG